LEENGLIYAEGEQVSKAESLAKFLMNTPRLDKKLIGEYISKHDNTELLTAYMRLFDFKGVRVFLI